jgi:predicted dehydrogenase
VCATVGQYLPDWRPGIDYRDSVSARKELGGGVLLELSHELDFVSWLLGKVASVRAKLGTTSELEVDVEDTSDLDLEFESGTVGSVHMDMVQRTPSRICTVTGTEGVMEWNGISRTSRLKLNDSNVWSLLSSGSSERNDIYLDELKHFLRCVKGDDEVLNSGQQGREVLELVQAARRSSELGELVRL